MTRFSIDSDAIVSASTTAQATIGRIQGEVGVLYGNLLNLQGSWGGQAAAAFQQAVNDWKLTQQCVEENLTALSTALRQAGHQYAEIEAANVRLFAR